MIRAYPHRSEEHRPLDAGHNSGVRAQLTQSEPSTVISYQHVTCNGLVNLSVGRITSRVHLFSAARLRIAYLVELNHFDAGSVWLKRLI